jgi:hypothetical protein
LKRLLRTLAPLAALASVLTVGSISSRADDYVAVRGFYYREASTRVIQPRACASHSTSSHVASRVCVSIGEEIE